MNTLLVELKKEKRTGIFFLLPLVGVIGASYAAANFVIRGEALLNLPLDPMDILLTQLYGVIVVLNMFAIIVGTCLIYNIEFAGGAWKKMSCLPIGLSGIYLAKYTVLAAGLVLAVVLENLALAWIGHDRLPARAFDLNTVWLFAAYSFVTAMPVLSLMLLVSSRLENLWIPLGIGVAGFLTGMAAASMDVPLLLLDPFVIMLQPAMAMKAAPNGTVIIWAVVETTVLLAAGLMAARRPHFG